jgi:hypothetical protein
LRLALANWEVQHEPADGRILLEAALATKDSAAAQSVLDFVKKTRLEDLEINRLAARLNPNNSLGFTEVNRRQQR